MILDASAMMPRRAVASTSPLRRAPRVREPARRRRAGAHRRPGQRPRHLLAAPRGAHRPARPRAQYIPLNFLEDEDQSRYRAFVDIYDSSARRRRWASSTATASRTPDGADPVGGAVRRLRQRRADPDRPVRLATVQGRLCGAFLGAAGARPATRVRGSKDMQVATTTTPAQIFHLLRAAQVHRVNAALLSVSPPIADRDDAQTRGATAAGLRGEPLAGAFVVRDGGFDSRVMSSTRTNTICPAPTTMLADRSPTRSTWRARSGLLGDPERLQQLLIADEAPPDVLLGPGKAPAELGERRGLPWSALTEPQRAALW